MKFQKPMSTRYFHHAMIAMLATIALCSSSIAFADQAGVVTTDPAPAVSASVLAWGSVTALLCTFIMNLTAPGTNTPWNWNPTTRFLLALAATTLSGVIHSLQSGVTVQTAVVTAVAAILTATLAHFSTPGAAAKTVGGAVLLLGLSAGASGCSWVQQEIAKSPTTIGADFELAANIANGVAKEVFATVEAQLPPSQQAAALAIFNAAEVVYGHAIDFLNDGLQAYSDGQSQDWAGLIASCVQAYDVVVAVVDQYGGSIPSFGAKLMGAPSYAASHAVLAAQSLRLHRFHL